MFFLRFFFFMSIPDIFGEKKKIVRTWECPINLNCRRLQLEVKLFHPVKVTTPYLSTVQNSCTARVKHCYETMYMRVRHWLVFTSTNVAVVPFIFCKQLEFFCSTAWLIGSNWTSNHGLTCDLMSLALGSSHLGVLVLIQRLLAQLIAICIALLVSQHCLCDILIFFFFLPSFCLAGFWLLSCILGRGIRRCLVCD